MTVSVGPGWSPPALTSQIHLHLFSLMLAHYKLNTLFTQQQSLTSGIVLKAVHNLELYSPSRHQIQDLAVLPWVIYPSIHHNL